MIRNEAEYQIASARLLEERNRLAEHRARLKSTNMSDEEIKRVIDPIESFHLQLKEEVESYERLKRREFKWQALHLSVSVTWAGRWRPIWSRLVTR